MCARTLLLTLLFLIFSPIVAQAKVDSSTSPKDGSTTQQKSGARPAPRAVSLALLLADISEVDGAGQAFSGDVYLLASWHDPELRGRFSEPRSQALGSVWHPTLIVYNLRAAAKLLPEEVLVLPDGTVKYLQRYTGSFSSTMDLREFPRDSQKFFVKVVAATGAGAKITLTPDLSIGTLRAEEFSITDWQLGEASLVEKPMIMAPGVPARPGVELSVPGKRKVTYYIIQVLIPLIAIVMMAYAVFWVATDVVATRVGVVVTTMLTLIAYRFMLANHVPKLAYLTRLDWFMLGATVLVLLTCFTMAGTSYLVGKGNLKLVKRIDRIGRVAYPAVFASYSLFVWFR